MVETNASTQKDSSRDKGVLKFMYWQNYMFPATVKVSVMTSVGGRKSLYEAYRYFELCEFPTHCNSRRDGPDV